MSTKKPRWIPLPLEPAAPWFRLPALTRSIGQYLFAAAQDRPILGIELEVEQVRGEEAYPQAESWALRQMSPDPDERKTIRAAIRKIVKRGLLVPIAGGMRLLYTPESYAEHQATVAQPSANGAPTVTVPSANGAPTLDQPSPNHTPTGEANAAKTGDPDSHREREKEKNRERENAREARSPLPADEPELEEGEPEPETSTLELVKAAWRARVIMATGNPPSQSHKLRPHYEAIAQWVDEKNGDPKRIVTSLMDGAFRDPWMQEKGYPLGSLAGSPGKYFDAQKNGRNPRKGFMRSARPEDFEGGLTADDVFPEALP